MIKNASARRRQTMQITGYAALKPKAKLKPFRYEVPRLGPYDVLIEVTHCGICHSDVHLIDDDWDFSVYPLVPGHEIVGHLKDAGSKVLHLKQGDRMGVGWQAGSCMNCEWCEKGHENLCADSKAVCNEHYGGFGPLIVCDSRFTVQVPTEIDSENAAPLLCGGITVYSPLKNHGVKPGEKIGVIGIGGLGHLAVQFANALGCEVTAFSSTSEKQKEAENFGAHRFVITKSRKNIEALAHQFDFLISTVNVNLDWKLYMDLLRPKGKLCVVGVPPSDIKVPPFSLIVGDRSLVGSVIGSPSGIREMLAFAARYKIKAKTELFPIGEINQAIQKVRKHQVRYRAVLKHELT